MKLCEYGCGLEAKHQFKNGKWCCSFHYLKCPVMRKTRNGEGNPFYNKKHTIETKTQIKESMTGTTREQYTTPIDNPDKILCSYGCGRIAKYQFKTGNYCCESSSSKCPTLKANNRKKNKDGGKDKQKFHITENINKIKCVYGCGNIAKYKNINGIYCCSSYPSKCLSLRKINKEKNTGKKHTEITISKMKDIQKKNKVRISQIKERYPLFSKIEEMRYNPNVSITKREIQVHCKNHDCKNSKEKGGWFTVEKTSLFSRIYAIEKISRDLHNLYCCQECKDVCPLYHSYGDPFKNNKLPYTYAEYQTFRIFVLERDDYICQFCGKSATHVHHERPQKLEPFYALDPAFAWSCCEECHYKKGHQGECSSINLAKVICSPESQKFLNQK